MTGKQLKQAWIAAERERTAFLQQCASDSRAGTLQRESYRLGDRTLSRAAKIAEQAYREWESAVCARYENLTLEQVLQEATRDGNTPPA